MTKKMALLPQQEIENRIFTLRSLQVMIDKDLAEMYGVETKVLNQAVKRNIERFPASFRFQITEAELNNLSRSQIVTLNNSQNLRSQIVTSNEDSLRSQIVTLKNGRGQHIKYLPYAFTEQGVAMLSAVLKSETAVRVSIQIMEAFVEMRKLVVGNSGLFQRLDKVETKQIEADQKFEQIFKALENKEHQPDKGIFFEGQIFDSYTFVADIIKKAEKSIIIIDNYIDETILTLLTKRKKAVEATIYTKQISKQLQLDLKKHNEQYPAIEIKILANSHDRFLIVDEQKLYHIGASLKDLGKKWFAFSKMDSLTNEVLIKLK
ncbi:MAG: ORF6N domain-containing protein [Bacteroidetes bacterium]|nr:ORF6N domain-containing protein [Bacteroidota bacterium]